uniref:Cathepsin propeptide inhibitor domain-containing protein n=1 Tax=Megaselia scalaris TaxID=36166 RepID=T1GSR0_MEGSC
MKVYLFCIFVLIFLGFYTVSSVEISDEEWTNFKEKFNKSYDEKEDLERREIYQKSKDKVLEHNKMYEEGKSSYNLELNAFADLKPREKLRALG